MRKHLVECISQTSHLVLAHLRRPHRIVVMVGDRPRCAGKAQNRIGDKAQELTRKQEREKERSGKNQRKNAAVEFEKLRRHCLQIRHEAERSFRFPIEHDRLCEENSIALELEARF